MLPEVGGRTDLSSTRLAVARIDSHSLSFETGVQDLGSDAETRHFDVIDLVVLLAWLTVAGLLQPSGDSENTKLRYTSLVQQEHCIRYPKIGTIDFAVFRLPTSFSMLGACVASVDFFLSDPGIDLQAPSECPSACVRQVLSSLGGMLPS